MEFGREAGDKRGSLTTCDCDLPWCFCWNDPSASPLLKAEDLRWAGRAFVAISGKVGKEEDSFPVLHRETLAFGIPFSRGFFLSGVRQKRLRRARRRGQWMTAFKRRCSINCSYCYDYFLIWLVFEEALIGEVFKGGWELV